MTTGHAQILAPIVEEIRTTYPHLPRGYMRGDQIAAAMYGTSNGPDYKAWTKVKILIESYAVLRTKGFLGAAAFLAVFRDGLTSTADKAQFEAQEIEQSCEFRIAYMNELCEMSLFGPEAELEHLRRIDRMTATMRTEKGRREATKLRGKTLAAIKQQYQQPKE